MKKLPIGIQTFPKLIDENCHYVDKTPLIAKLVENGQCYFLSRPRRFGKSLLLSTLKSAFAGEKELFKGLYLENNWDWSKQYPVIHISFGRGGGDSLATLQQSFSAILNEQAQDYGITLCENGANNRFAELIKALYRLKKMPVVVLIDEYDKPILDNLQRPDIAESIRDEMRRFYSILKDSDPYLKFVLLTGVSKFSKISLFSGLNNLKDISLNPDYATLCGYTEPEIRQVFAERLDGVDFDQLAAWYNGYNFLGEKVYNPFGTLLFLESKRFKNYWFETGSPSFLLKLVRDRQYYLPDMENIVLNEGDLGSFDVNDISLETVLFQTGYLTIKAEEAFDGESVFFLSYPNREVKMSLNRHLLRDLTHTHPGDMSRHHLEFRKAMQLPDFERLAQAFKAFFASIPHDWFRKNQMANYEGYYASIVYSCFCALGFAVIAEDATSHGRIDLTVMFDDKVFIIEFKALNDDDKQGTALKQIKAKGYQQKYSDSGKKIFLIGMEFDRQQRNLSFFEWEAL